MEIGDTIWFMVGDLEPVAQVEKISEFDEFRDPIFHWKDKNGRIWRSGVFKDCVHVFKAGLFDGL